MKPLLRRFPLFNRRWLSFFGSLVIISLPVTAQWAEQPPRTFTIHDTDRDGYLSREEYRVLLELRRARAARHPGVVPQPAPAFEEVDRDGDGRITEDELTDMLQHQMYRYRHKGPPWR